jgi:hypothetical protein
MKKILFVTSDRQAAQLGAHALQGMAPGSRFTWTQTPESALRWLHANPDAAAVVIEAETRNAGASFRDRVRALGFGSRVVVIAPGRMGTWLTPSAAGVPRVAEQRPAQRLAPEGRRPEKLTVALQQRLLELEKVLDESRRAQKTEQLAAADRLARREAESVAALSRAAATQAAIEQKLADSIARAAHVRQRAEADLKAAAFREGALKNQVAEATAAREALRQNLAASEAARVDADRRHATRVAEALARLNDLQTRYDAVLAIHATARVNLEQQLADAEASRQQLASEVADAVAREAALNDRLATYETALRDHEAARTAFEQQLADADAATQQLESEAAAVAAREAALSERLAAETAAREATEHKLAAAEAARADADRRHATELAKAAAHLADLETAYDDAVAEHAAARASLEQQLSEGAAVRQDLLSQATAAAERESALVDQLARETAARGVLEQQLAGAETARADADRRRAIELTEAAARLAELQSAYDAAQAAHAAARAALEQELDDAAADAAAAAQVRRDLESELGESRTNAAAARRRLLNLAIRRRRRTRELIAQLAAQLDDERTGAQRALAAKDETLRESEAERARLSGAYDQARQSLDHLGISFVALERVASENTAERARLESVVAERDAQLRMQVERHLTAERTATDTIEALRQELQAACTRAATLQRDAERAAVLQNQLGETLRESRRLFERAPYGLCRFMPDGAFIKANHSFARLLGYRKADDIRSVSLGKVFECAADLRWVVERAAGAAATATIETALKTRHGRRLEARLHALSHADGTVDLAVQDLSSVRALEARLREAQRMEAVGRLASEVAVTCDMVLRDVTDGGRAWLAAIENHPELRHQGERLLGEVTRAAGLLRDFSVYGRKQISALEPVSVQQVIRNVAPVVKRVAGDDIEWVLPKLSRPVYVDVDAERVERVLVNVASYARERMPHGGRVRIDVATTVLGHDFNARYPNVRPGAHALITIAEIKRVGRPDAWPEPYAESSAPVAAAQSTSDRTGVDLGALLALLGDCGGHLWIAAERSGNMTLKVHLPRRVSSDTTASAVPATRTDRVRQLAGWFRH